MPIVIKPLGETLAAEVTGLDLPASLSADVVDRIRAAFLEHLVLCFRGETLAPRVFLDLAQRFGKPVLQLRRRSRHDEVPEVSILRNDDRTLGDGKPYIVGSYWHTDDSYMAIPCNATLLHPQELPGSGGDTRFVNTRAAYDALPEKTKTRIDGLKVVHTFASSRAGGRLPNRTEEEKRETPDVIHPLVRTHPDTGRKALYLNPNRIECILGMARAESDALLDQLIAHATQPEFEYRHAWRPGDVVIWDNRCTMHRACEDVPEGQRRVMHRILLEGARPY